MADTSSRSLDASREYPARTSSSYLMLVLLVIAGGMGVFFTLSLAMAGGSIFVIGLCVALFILISKGFYMLQPNQAAVITLFGNYHDVERRAALVSNLMVVLCSERDTQPIVNAGTQHE